MLCYVMVIGYDAGGHIIVGDGVAGWIYYYIVVGGIDSPANSGPVGVVGVAGVGCNL